MHYLVIITILLVVYLFLRNRNKEHYGSGALMQLYAKGPQDTYLTADAAKYIPYWYYPMSLWNNPTRYGNSWYYPYMYYSPNSYYPYFTYFGGNGSPYYVYNGIYDYPFMKTTSITRTTKNGKKNKD
jgi:hypothetical protein